MEWISTKDRLPEDETKYLCWEAYYSGSTGYPVIGLFAHGEFHTGISDDFTDVTHWAYLPDPPKQKDNKCFTK